MRFDLHLRSVIRDQIEQLAESMRSWEEKPRIDEREKMQIQERLSFFEHMTTREDLLFAGADGTGDFPSVSYSDSFIYVTVAQGTVYQSHRVSGLQEVGPAFDPVVHFTWIPEEEGSRRAALDEAFAYLAGAPIEAVIERSDYHRLKAVEVGRRSSVAGLADSLIRPHAADAGNIGLQLRSTAEAGAALRIITGKPSPTYMLVDGTLSLPLVGTQNVSLFYEHVKRLCCAEARARGIVFFALSRSHGLPSVEIVEEIAREKAGLVAGAHPEHWYLRVPVPKVDRWELSMAQGRRLPPPGAVTYLVRFHRTTPVMRLDMDEVYWRETILGRNEEETRSNERRIFGDLDYACHDQRCYGYPYPLKAGHDRASLTEAERVALRKQIIDAAVRAGMKRSLFRSAAQATGHE